MLKFLLELLKNLFGDRADSGTVVEDEVTPQDRDEQYVTLEDLKSEVFDDWHEQGDVELKFDFHFVKATLKGSVRVKGNRVYTSFSVNKYVLATFILTLLGYIGIPIVL